MKKTLIVSLLMGVACIQTQAADYLKNLSFSPLGVIKYEGITGKPNYGVGFEVAYDFNKYVTAQIRAVGYEAPDHWQGGAVDEGGAYISATLLQSKNGGISLYAIGGVDRNFSDDAWGFSLGPGVAVRLHKNVSLFGEYRLRAWMRSLKEDAQVVAGVTFNF